MRKNRNVIYEEYSHVSIFKTRLQVYIPFPSSSSQGIPSSVIYNSSKKRILVNPACYVDGPFVVSGDLDPFICNASVAFTQVAASLT